MGKFHCVVYNILCMVKAKRMTLLEMGSQCACTSAFKHDTKSRNCMCS
jgi:ABC-type enterobactin transport system permease subunit